MKHYTGRTPRTLNQAFGPYAELHVKPDPFLTRISKLFWSMFR